MSSENSARGACSAQTWRLSRSVDGGASFTTVFEATHATNPPVLETDSQDTVYLARMDWKESGGGDGHLYRFTKAKDYKDPEVTAIPRADAKHVVLMKDLSRQGVAFLHAAQLFPGERVELTLPTGRIAYTVVRCLRHNHRCYEIGAEID